jgi:hypothetical protein
VIDLISLLAGHLEANERETLSKVVVSKLDQLKEM